MPSDAGLPVLPCLCASLRRASRAVSQVYDAELRGEGLRATQFTLLYVLSLQSGATQGEIGEYLALDSTTLTRTLRPLEAKGWIRPRSGEDRREVRWELTRAGEKKLARARPAWQRAQDRVRSRLDAGLVQALLSDLGVVAGAARR